MKKVVFTINDAVCTANGKDINATELLAKMANYGTVVDYDREVASLKAEYQNTINGLTAQNASLKDHNLTPDELIMLRAYRDSKAQIVADYEDTIAKCEAQLQAVKIEAEDRLNKIRSFLGE